MTAGALLAFTACSNDSDGVPQEPEAQLSDLTIRVETYKAPATRGVVEVPLENTPAVVDKAMIYLVGSKEAPKEIELKDGKGFYTFENVLVNGTEKVRIVAWNSTENTDKEDYEIYELQPTKGTGTVGGIANSVYSGEKGLSPIANTPEGKKQYEAEVSLTSLTARLELMGDIKYNKELVSDLKLAAVVPIQFRVKYKDPLTKIITPKSGDGNELWWAEGNSTAGIEEGKALANHLFAGDKLAFAVGIQPTLYACEKDTKGYIKLNYAEEGQPEQYSAIYQVSKDSEPTKYYINKGTFENPEFFKVSKIKEGKYSIGVKDDDMEFDKIKTETLTDNKDFVSFFNMASKKTPTYDGGKIYKIQLGTLDWGTSNGYSPDVNTGNPGTPEVKDEADVIVTATVVDWTVENTTAGLE